MHQVKYRNALPQLSEKLFVTDGGLETVLVFQRGIDLPEFASFPLLSSDDGTERLIDYYKDYIDVALSNRSGLILDTATWRASRGWGEKLGFSADDIVRLNQHSVKILESIRQLHETDDSPMVINGVVGPQDDGYNPSALLDVGEAQAYHRQQVDTFANSAADMITAVTMTYVDEAVGIVRAAKNAGIPVAVSFTVETDGQLPDGTALADAIFAVDAATGSAPCYYMVNCAHPDHFSHVLRTGGTWKERVFGVRANASRKSHAELDEATELDDGNPVEFGELYADLRRELPALRIVGGCCGTDHRHVGSACAAIRAVDYPAASGL